jgi:hypothetical protein
MGASQRNKGHSFERTVVNKLKEEGIQAERVLEYQQHQAKGVDVSTEKFAIQCKAKKTQPNVPNVFNEIQDTKRIPVVIYKIDRKGTFATFKIDDALTLMKLFDKKKGKGV